MAQAQHPNSSVYLPVALDNAGVLQASTAEADLAKISILPGHEPDYSACTFCLNREDHTLGNALRWMVMKDPDVEYCGYSAPHPAEDKIHLRIQMYDNISAVECLRKALRNLRDLFTTVKSEYALSLVQGDFLQTQDVDVRAVVDAKIKQKRKELERSQGKAPGTQGDVNME